MLPLSEYSFQTLENLKPAGKCILAKWLILEYPSISKFS